MALIDAQSLTPGNHAGTLIFTSTTLSSTVAVPVNLTVRNQPGPGPTPEPTLGDLKRVYLPAIQRGAAGW